MSRIDAAGRASSHSAQCWACARRAAASVPESTNGWTRSSPGRSATTVAGASSMMTCVFVPLIPNELMPARRTRRVRGHRLGFRRSSSSPPVQSIRVFGFSAWSVRGSHSCWSASTILMTPMTPEAAWAWPMLDLADPRCKGRTRPENTAARAPASMGSPSTVPVACASTASMSAGASPPSARALRSTRCCARPFGAVSPWLRPSWFMAVPRTTASTRSPSRLASESRLSTRTPQPSAQLVPSASSAKLLQRPSAASPLRRLNSTKICGVLITVTPPASARSHSPLRSASHARRRATSDELHAVSMVSAGPDRPNV
ncbi:hypothetical protein SMICM17S_08352 [Streptomyces microflavus]